MSKKSKARGLPLNLLGLCLLFVLALLPRLYSAQTLGWDWDSPGSFTLVNFDEGGSCRAALDGFKYTGFIGYQTIAIASAMGNPPPPGIAGNDAAVKQYCQQPGHLMVARSYSAVTGALTVVLAAVLATLLVPGVPAIGWTAGGLLALSGFHIGESLSGTVDAPSSFFIYLFVTALVWAVTRGSVNTLRASPLLLVAAVWTKYWVFAVFAYLAWLPARAWAYVSEGFGRVRIVLVAVAAAMLFGLMSNIEFREAGLYPLMALFYLFIPWRRIKRPMILAWLLLPPLVFMIMQVDSISRFSLGSVDGRFGSSYAAIGWHKWIRNLFNLPMVFMVGLGLPALAMLPKGISALAKGEGHVRAWCCLLPLFAFLLFMAFVSPITYYRHYLPLLPVAAIIAAWGFHRTRWAGKRWALVVFLLWPALLAVDLVSDYHNDPRKALRQWYAGHAGARVLASFYVNPPASSTRLFRPEHALGDGRALAQAQYLILSENWYDTSYANELNGPLVNTPSRMIKTTPEYITLYRDVIAGRHPNLKPEKTIALKSFMPELILHRAVYGNFQLFVGDLRIFRIVPAP
jgi:hypothetical protein